MFNNVIILYGGIMLILLVITVGLIILVAKLSKMSRNNRKYTNCYQENGFTDREDYLHFVATTYYMDYLDVKQIADSIGDGEDFFKLITILDEREIGA